jgi:hypothetical protein
MFDEVRKRFGTSSSWRLPRTIKLSGLNNGNLCTTSSRSQFCRIAGGMFSVLLVDPGVQLGLYEGGMLWKIARQFEHNSLDTNFGFIP